MELYTAPTHENREVIRTEAAAAIALMAAVWMLQVWRMVKWYYRRLIYG